MLFIKDINTFEMRHIYFSVYSGHITFSTSTFCTLIHKYTNTGNSAELSAVNSRISNNLLRVDFYAESITVFTFWLGLTVFEIHLF